MIIINNDKDYASKNNNEQYRVKVEYKVKDKQYRVVGDYASKSRGRKLYK